MSVNINISVVVLLYITNLVRIEPNTEDITLYWIPSSGTANPPHLTRIINGFSMNLVASALTYDYEDHLESLKAGTYIACLARNEKIKDESGVLEEIKEATKRCIEIEKSKQMDYICKNLLNDFENSRIKIEKKQLFSTSYIIPRLLNNALSKIIPGDLLCEKHLGEVNAICLDIVKLNEYYQKLSSIKDRREMEPLFNFCENYPTLCLGDQENECSQFFKVLKYITLRFQQVTENHVGIYLIFYSRYSRKSNLYLGNVIDYMIKKSIPLDHLIKVRVNYVTKDGYTKLCEIVSIDKGADLLTLKCDDDNVNINLNSLLSNIQLQQKISINPTYHSSREFIETYLCKDFDKHKELNIRYPKKYFETLKNDLEILKSIIGDKIYLSNAYYKLRTLLEVE